MAHTRGLRQRTAPWQAALQMLRGRSLRNLLMIFQFTIGFSALIILTVLIAQSEASTRTLERTFTTPHTLGLYPTGGDAPLRQVRPPLSPQDLPALEALPGVSQAAVLWRSAARLPDGNVLDLYVVNRALEALVPLRVVERLEPEAPPSVSEAGDRWVFLTPAARQRFTSPDGTVTDSVTFQVAGKEITARVAGVVSPPTGWPGSTGSLKDFALNPPAIVIDLAAVRDKAWLTNSTWLILEEEADPAVVRQEVQVWFRTAYPDWEGTLDGMLVADEIASRAASRQPGTWVAAILATLFILLAGLGFTGHAMLMADLRKSEWALRLALGATRLQLTLQILIETALVVLTAALLSLLIVTPIVPALTESTDFAVPFNWLSTALAVIALGALAVSAAAAAYPIRRIRLQEPSVLLKENG